MTTMNGKIVIAGNSIEELERELATVKSLIAMGKTYGVGGNSIAEVENGLKMVDDISSHSCNCNGHCNCHHCEDDYEYLCDEEEEDEYDEWEEEEDDLDEITDDLKDVGKALKDVLKKLGEI